MAHKDLPKELRAPTRAAMAEARARAKGDRALLVEQGDDRFHFLVRSSSQDGVSHMVSLRGLTHNGVLFACSCEDGQYRPDENGCHHRGAVGRRLERQGLVRWDDVNGNWFPTALGRPIVQAAQRQLGGQVVVPQHEATKDLQLKAQRIPRPQTDADDPFRGLPKAGD